ncbi:hypothetical protein KUTeg_001936 [Tegillarca granosa]|uniref:Cleavage stimulation factor 50 kDa subunit n=1 Tax=Tegillarca granosa TaxID=220873 RepID=A0ABQ9FSV8_TEGGR|nr:hypothetical protein KUTeg_001936 [Tegillarca granosa]
MSGDSEIKQRELMYRLMISQLFYDGHQGLAVNLSNIVKAHPACPPADRLFKVLKFGLEVEEELSGQKKLGTENVAPGSGIDLEYETDVQTISPEAAQYETCYVTAHKGPCRAGAFHNGGKLIATGSEDASIKILDVERMLAKSATPAEIIAMETPQQAMENHPVIRTLYDHSGEVTCLDFHPQHQILASGSRDYSVRFFEFSKPSVKKAYKSIQEAAEVRCLSFHPSGDYILVGTQHPTCMYHKCWCDSQSIRLYQSQYVLSSGKDSLVKLWELSTNRCLIVYTGAGATGKQEHRTQAVFNHTEDYGHNGAVRYIAHAPTGPAFITCSEDFRARFWYRKADSD